MNERDCRADGMTTLHDDGDELRRGARRIALRVRHNTVRRVAEREQRVRFEERDAAWAEHDVPLAELKKCGMRRRARLFQRNAAARAEASSRALLLRRDDVRVDELLKQPCPDLRRRGGAKVLDCNRDRFKARRQPMHREGCDENVDNRVEAWKKARRGWPH